MLKESRSKEEISIQKNIQSQSRKSMKSADKVNVNTYDSLSPVKQIINMEKDMEERNSQG